MLVRSLCGPDLAKSASCPGFKYLHQSMQPRLYSISAPEDTSIIPRHKIPAIVSKRNTCDVNMIFDPTTTQSIIRTRSKLAFKRGTRVVLPLFKRIPNCFSSNLEQSLTDLAAKSTNFDLPIGPPFESTYESVHLIECLVASSHTLQTMKLEILDHILQFKVAERDQMSDIPFQTAWPIVSRSKILLLRTKTQEGSENIVAEALNKLKKEKAEGFGNVCAIGLRLAVFGENGRMAMTRDFMFNPKA